MQKLLLISILLFIAFTLSFCKKNGAEDKVTPTDFKLAYGDSTIYLKEQAEDYFVLPDQQAEGTYSAFPIGIEIDQRSGAINVSQSETGLRYRVSFTSVQGDNYQTMILLSGINYTDHFHKLVQGDSVSTPLYNVDQTLPAASFDYDNTARNAGLVINRATGAINLKASIRNGLFGPNPVNDSRKEVAIKYRINDQSRNAANSIKVLFYWYGTMEDVPADVKQLIQEREPMFLRTSYPGGGNDPGFIRTKPRPRPPCIIVIAQ
jgi:hypothetical protein